MRTTYPGASMQSANFVFDLIKALSEMAADYQSFSVYVDHLVRNTVVTQERAVEILTLAKRCKSELAGPKVI